MVSATVCVLGFSLLIAGENPRMGKDTRYWVATNLCAAAHDAGLDPRLLGAYLLNENRGFDLRSVRPAKVGADHGLFQINSHYQHDRPNVTRAHHPYYGALLAAGILQDNLKAYGWTWQAFAAYWSQEQARRGTIDAKAYYRRFVTHYGRIAQRFRLAQATLESDPSVAQARAPVPIAIGGRGPDASQRTNKRE